MWNLVSFTTDATGEGSANISISAAQILGNIAIPVQPGIVSGATDLTVSHLFPAGLTPIALYTVTNLVTPFSEVPKRLGVSPVNVADTVLGFQMVGSINIAVRQATANTVVNILVLLSD